MIAGHAGASRSTARSSLTFRSLIPRKGCRTKSGIASAVLGESSEFVVGLVNCQEINVRFRHARPKRIVIIVAAEVFPALEDNLFTIRRPRRVAAIRFLFIRQLTEARAIRIDHEYLRIR